MIIDSHCHAWELWPYLPEVPDPESRGIVEQLLFEMDKNGVDMATIVCAQIWQNPSNNDYIAAAVRKNPDRLRMFADVDSNWSETYHVPGAAKRLEETAMRLPMAGFTHYVATEDNGDWFTSPDGDDFFGVANEMKLIASIACGPQHQPAIRRIAEKWPDIPILCHHMSGLRATDRPPSENLQNVLASAELPNVHLKLSGFHYATEQSARWEYPYNDARWVYEAAYERYGSRMCWGSDYPVVRTEMIYRQALEAFRTHCTFVSEEDRELILGGTLAKILDRSRKIG